jgi:hypothetical protein
MVSTDAPGAKRFLEQLYLNDILAFEDLPQDAKFAVNTMKMAAELRMRPRLYADRLLNSRSAEDSGVILQLLGRVLPSLIEERNWALLLFVAKVVRKKAAMATLSGSGATGPADPLGVVFKDSTDQVAAAYLNGEASERRTINAILDQLGPRGAEILGKVLAESRQPEVLKDVTDSLIKNKKHARRWALQVMADPEPSWHLLEKALGVLGRVGHGDGDVQKVKALCDHSHPRIREAALHAVMDLKPEVAEPVIMAALSDDDEKVRWRAASALNGISALSRASRMKLLVLLRSRFPEEKEAALAHTAKLVQVVRAIGPRTDLTYPEQFEDALLELTQNIPLPEKGLLRRLKKSVDAEQPPLLSSIIHTLGQIGGPNSEAFLAKLAKGKSPQAADAQEALDRIRARNG